MAKPPKTEKEEEPEEDLEEEELDEDDEIELIKEDLKEFDRKYMQLRKQYSKNTRIIEELAEVKSRVWVSLVNELIQRLTHLQEEIQDSIEETKEWKKQKWQVEELKGIDYAYELLNDDYARIENTAHVTAQVAIQNSLTLANALLRADEIAEEKSEMIRDLKEEPDAEDPEDEG